MHAHGKRFAYPGHTKSCRTGALKLLSLQTLNATNKSSRHSLLKVTLITTGAFMVWFSVLWFGLAFAPLLVARNDGLRAAAQVRNRAISTNVIVELLSGGRTFVSAFHYVMESEPDIKTAQTNFTLVQTGSAPLSYPAGYLSNSAGFSVSNSWRASRELTNAAG